jgi:hypothetical protein
VTRHRHRTSTSAPLSTKIVVWLGLGLVAFGFGMAGWQRLTPEDAPDEVSPATQAAQQYLPDMHTVALYLLFFLIAVLGGAYVLVRSRRRRAGF